MFFSPRFIVALVALTCTSLEGAHARSYTKQSNLDKRSNVYYPRLAYHSHPVLQLIRRTSASTSPLTSPPSSPRSPPILPLTPPLSPLPERPQEVRFIAFLTLNRLNLKFKSHQYVEWCGEQCRDSYPSPEQECFYEMCKGDCLRSDHYYSYWQGDKGKPLRASSICNDDKGACSALSLTL